MDTHPPTAHMYRTPGTWGQRDPRLARQSMAMTTGWTGLVLVFDMMISWWTTFPSEGDWCLELAPARAWRKKYFGMFDYEKRIDLLRNGTRQLVFICIIQRKNDWWRPSFALLDVGIQRFKRDQIRTTKYLSEWILSSQEYQREVWLVSPCTKWQLYFISHHTTDKVQGECRSRAKPPQFGFLPLHSVWNLTSRIHFNQQDSDGFKLYRSRRSKWQVLSNCKCGVTRTSSWGYKTVYEERKETQRM